jgi:uncharacterized protein involved in exopolysaccharide biosynthesis
MRAEEHSIARYNPQASPTLREVAAVLFRHRWAMLTVFIAVLALVAVSGVWIPKYDSEMKILVRRQRSDAIVTSSANAPAQFSGDQVSEEDLNSEVELLNSNGVLRDVVLATGLAAKPRSSDDRDAEAKIAAAVRSLSGDLQIDAVPKTNVITVHYAARDPQMVANVLKTLAAGYTEKHMAVHRTSGEFKFFDQQTDQYKKGLDRAQASLTEFTKGTGIVSAESERNSALQQADQFDSIASQAQYGAAETEQRVRTLATELHSVEPRLTTAVRTLDNSQLLQQAKSTLLNLELKRTELLTKFDSSYPLVQEVNEQIAETQKAVSTEQSMPSRDETVDQNPTYAWISAEISKAQADLSTFKARASAAASTAVRYRAAARRLDEDGIIQKNLLEDAKTQDDNYLLYVHKREEARISNALDERGILNVTLADEPLVPALPKRSVMSAALLALLFAGGFSVAAAYLLDRMDPTFRTPNELAGYLGRPVVGALPKGGS